MTLKGRRQRFVEEYLIDLNAAAAYQRAGYKAPTPQQAAANSARLIANDSIQAAITAARQKQAGAARVTAEEVLAGLKKEANLTGEGSSHAARVAAWTALGKHLRLFADRLEVTQEARLKIVKVVVTTHADRTGSDRPGGNGAAASGSGGVLPQ